MVCGLGLPNNRHVSFELLFQEGAGAVNPDAPLPEDEPILPVAELADKGCWWLEKKARCEEVGNPEYDPDYGKRIMYSMIDLQKGLLYRLRRALYSGASMG